MKQIFANIALVSALSSVPCVAMAGSIQVLAPSTAKIEVIGMAKEPDVSKDTTDASAKLKYIGTADKPAAETAAAKPVLSAVSQLRTGEVALPVVKVASTSAEKK